MVFRWRSTKHLTSTAGALYVAQDIGSDEDFTASKDEPPTDASQKCNTHNHITAQFVIAKNQSASIVMSTGIPLATGGMRALERIKHNQESMASNPGYCEDSRSQQAAPVQAKLTGEARALARLRQRLSNPLTRRCVVKDDLVLNSHQTHAKAAGDSREPGAPEERRPIADESSDTSLEGRTMQSHTSQTNCKQRRSVSRSRSLEGGMDRQSSHARNRSIELTAKKKTNARCSRSASFPGNVGQQGVCGPSTLISLADGGQVLRRSSTRRSAGARSDKGERRRSRSNESKAPRPSISQRPTMSSGHEQGLEPTTIPHDRRRGSKRTSAEGRSKASPPDSIALRHRRGSSRVTQSRCPPVRRSQSMGDVDNVPCRRSAREIEFARRRSSTAGRRAKSTYKVNQAEATTASTNRSHTRRSARATTVDNGANEDAFSGVSAHSTQSHIRQNAIATKSQSTLRRESESRFHSDWDSFSDSDGASFAGENQERDEPSGPGHLRESPTCEGDDDDLTCHGDDDMDKDSSWKDDDSIASFASSRSERSRTCDAVRVSALVASSRARAASMGGFQRSSSSSCLPLPFALTSHRHASLTDQAPGKILSRVPDLRESVGSTNDERLQSLGRRRKEEPTKDQTPSTLRASSSHTIRRVRLRTPSPSTGPTLGQASVGDLKASTIHTSSPSRYNSGLRRPSIVEGFDRWHQR